MQRSISPRVSFAESRPVFWFKEVGPNLTTWGKDLKRYVDQPYKEGNPLKAGLGAVMIVSEGVLRSLDMVFAGIVDQKKEAPSGFMGRTTQAGGQLLKNVVTLHPLRAAGNASELIFSFPWALDLVDAAAFDRRQRETREKIGKTLGV